MSEKSERTLRAGERRYEARRCGKTWEIYDRVRGSWPKETPQTGRIPDKMTEAEAKTLADQLEDKRG